MRESYIVLLFLIFGAGCLSAQNIVVVPLESNPQVKRVYQNQMRTLVREYGLFISNEKNDCPPNIVYTNRAVVGTIVELSVDTVGSRLMGDTVSYTEIINCTVLNFGSASGNMDSLALVTYEPNAGVQVGFDTICVKVCSLTDVCDTILTPVFVTRAGRSIDVDGPIVQPFDVVAETCVDFDFPGELTCNQIIDCEDDYDGEGQQNVFPVNYSEDSPCLFYQASGFPGEDQVCYVLCDDYAICDTFNVTYTIPGESVSLPFFDDFSDLSSPYPRRQNWLDNDVYINSTMAPNPPSIGIATFDGLDRRGQPYLESGIADRLTSKYIDLSGYSSADELHLKVYVSLFGYGVFPNVDDPLVLEFRDENRVWNEVKVYEGFTSNPETDEFSFVFDSIVIENGQYFYPEFQFRFTAYTSPAGQDDLWHIDYVLLEDSPNKGPSANDISLVDLPTSILSRYHDMPYNQFRVNASEELESNLITSNFFNHNVLDDEEVTNSNVQIVDMNNMTELTPGVTLVDNFSVESRKYKSNEKEDSNFWAENLMAIQQLSADRIDVELGLKYLIENPSQDPNALGNDNAVHITRLSNYYAYGDGSAEQSVILKNSQGTNPAIGIAFGVNTMDTLRAVAIQFTHPDGADYTSQRFDLMIYANLPLNEDILSFLNNNDPDLLMKNLNPLYPDLVSDTLQAYTTYVLKNEEEALSPIALEANSNLIICFVQKTATLDAIPIGYDKQTDDGQYLYFRSDENWIVSDPLGNENGSLGIRAIMGPNTPIASDIDNNIIENYANINWYPNPATDQISFEIMDSEINLINTEIRLYNSLGQNLKNQKNTRILDISNIESGVYFVQLYHNNFGVLSTQKTVICKDK